MKMSALLKYHLSIPVIGMPLFILSSRPRNYPERLQGSRVPLAAWIILPLSILYTEMVWPAAATWLAVDWIIYRQSDISGKRDDLSSDRWSVHKFFRHGSCALRVEQGTGHML
jgi:hypothetical protein